MASPTSSMGEHGAGKKIIIQEAETASLIQFQSRFSDFDFGSLLAGIITAPDEQSGNPSTAVSLC